MNLVLEEPVFFSPGTADLKKESEAVLLKVKDFLVQKDYITLLRIEGHITSTTNNQTISEQRAMAVAKWLIRNGVDCKRLLPVGFGETKLIVLPDSPEKEKNTRIVFAMSALRGKPIGGMPVDGGGKVAGDPCR